MVRLRRTANGSSAGSASCWTLFEGPGTVRLTLTGDPGDCAGGHGRCRQGGIDFTDVNRVLEEEGIEKFEVSFDRLLGASTEGGVRSRWPPRLELTQYEATLTTVSGGLQQRRRRLSCVRRTGARGG